MKPARPRDAARLEVGPLDADGYRAWRACVHGDASLFWVREVSCTRRFPSSPPSSSSVPMLIRSEHGIQDRRACSRGRAPAGRPISAGDRCCRGPGCSRASRSVLAGLARVRAIDADAWRKDLDSLRKTNEMVNDDCTLVVLRIMGSEPEAAAGEETEPDYIPD